MNILKTRKGKLITISLASTAVVASTTGVLLYGSISETKSRNFTIADTIKPKLINKDNLDFDNVRQSNTDAGLKEKPKPEPVPEPTPTPKPPVIIPEPEPIEKPEIKPEPAPLPEPEKVEEPKPEPLPVPEPLEEPPIILPKPEPVPEPKPEPVPVPEPAPQPIPQPKPAENDVIIVIKGVPVKADVTKPTPRPINNYDLANNIANNEPYIAELVGKVNSIEVTDELRRKVVAETVQKMSFDLKNPNDTFGFIGSIVEHFHNDFNEVEKFIQQQPENWEKIVYKFSRIINSPNVVNYLKEEAKPLYPEMMRKPNKIEREYWLINNLDLSLFTKLSAQSEKFLKEGYTLDPDNGYVNERGEWESHTYNPPDGFNTVTTRMIRDNQYKRAFGYDTWYPRSSENIKSGKYPGWTKTNVKNDAKFQKYDVGSTKGIQIFEIKRDTEQPGDFNKGYIVEIDTADPNAYNKTKKLIEDLKRDNIEISSYRLFNMGKSASNQRFSDILSALPNELRQLELFFDASAANTSSLIALENKKIKELSLYTEGNSLLEYWSLNPWALKNVNWVNTIDYNVSFENPANTNIPTRITFNALAFEESDILKGQADPYKRINDGLRMAYFVRNNEGIFQGGMGPGLSPDHNEGGNSYPTGLDLTRARSLRSLKGLKFYDQFKPSNKPRKLKTLRLYSSGDTFDIDGSELNEAGFENMAIGEMGPPKTKIVFSNKDQTRYVHIKGNQPLSGNGLTNLRRLYGLAESLDKTTIKVDPGASSLASQLRSNGYTVIENSSDDLVIT
ncbi:putative immunoglobulin-blocking virulence protein [Mycoplasmopsis felifaucium]|uniref:putative immunoglobulin-blocking virulence protein n=1 Tax=Mycoplasmopsis felifaucium TaxID=35768 RepID=UPI0004875042|nr:putative immunoglobulin-blocking virulence protein [Mycoplasmopsis felifaucium]